MWDLPGPGLEPVSPVLAGGFLTTVQPGKSLDKTLGEVSGHGNGKEGGLGRQVRDKIGRTFAKREIRPFTFRSQI